MLHCTVCVVMVYTLLCTALHCSVRVVFQFTMLWSALRGVCCASPHSDVLNTAPFVLCRTALLMLCRRAQHCASVPRAGYAPLALCCTQCVHHAALHCAAHRTALCVPCCSALCRSAPRYSGGANNGITSHLHHRRPRDKDQPGGPLLARCPAFGALWEASTAQAAHAAHHVLNAPLGEGVFALRAHCALLLDYVPPEEPPSTPLGNTLRIR